jgi:acetolactate synthase I/II/III large subunit
MTVAEILISTLSQHGVEWIGTLCGHGLDPLFQAARAAGIRLVDTRNEQTASYMADAWGRLTRRPGVCAVSSGVAHVNALAGVANAWFDGAPMLLLSGAGALATAGMGHFQDMDQVALARPLCKYARVLDRPERVAEIVEEALREAVSGTPGPVHLTLPMDVERAQVEQAGLTPAMPRPGTRTVSASPDEVSGALARALRPLVIAGSGLYYSGQGAAALAACERLGLPLMTPIWDRGLVDRPSPAFLGVVGAATGGPDVLSEADCIVMAGAAVDYRTGYLLPPAIRSDARVLYFDGPWDVIDSATPFAPWLRECSLRRDRFRDAIARRGEDAAAQGPHAVDVIHAIRSVLSADPVLLIDGGNIGQWAHQLLCRDRYPGDWLTCGRSGVVGWGIGGAMAARLACPDRPVVLLSGDGSFTFNLADLESASRQGLGFTAVVADDQGWGITRTGHRQQFGEPIASGLGPVDFARAAQALGARGVRAEGRQAVGKELREAIGRPGVTVIHAPILESGLQ